MAEVNAARVAVWYDGDCPLCRREVRWIRRLDRSGTIAFIDLSLGEPCPVDRRTMLARFHAQEGGKGLVSGAAAFGAMWRQIPALRPLGLLALWPPALWSLERAYLVFLRIRPTLQAIAARRSLAVLPVLAASGALAAAFAMAVALIL